MKKFNKMMINFYDHSIFNVGSIGLLMLDTIAIIAIIIALITKHWNGVIGWGGMLFLFILMTCFSAYMQDDDND